ncbi:hypothetical protein [Bacillus litorisediminis]|uniref:hypothetical protein n=1 Tax=Bacillus litorisediminis TaxID=2922713 RepID=UPI001FAC9FD0|nr:hypothetical protein [Bacillus litorisediminis]
MPQQRIYHDYINEKLVPFWYVLTFRPCEVNWDKHVHYFEIIAPFEHFNRDDFNDSIISTSLYLSDLIISESKPNQLGIYLKKVKHRILQHGIDPELVLQFIVPIPDIDEVLKLIPYNRTISFLSN